MAINTVSNDQYWNTTTAINNTAGNMNFTTTAANTNYAAGVSYIPFTYTYNTYQAPLPAYDFYAGEPMEEVVKKLRDHIKNLEGRIQQLETPLPPISYNANWLDLVSMLENIRHHIKGTPGAEVWPADNPRELKFGFVCSLTGKIWEIAISTVKAQMQKFWINDGQGIIIPDCFYSQEGKMELCKMLNRK